MRRSKWIPIIAFAVLLAGCAEPKPVANVPAYQPVDLPPPVAPLLISERPAALEWPISSLNSIPSFDANSATPSEVDLRHKDLSGADPTGRLKDLLLAIFDTATKWPAGLLASFNPQAIMEIGKNPGLNVRRLHESGITGEGVSIGIIDQKLLVEHEEYADRIKYYLDLDIESDSAAMHGPAVASIAVGKTVGVAPGADLYYVTPAYTSGEEIDRTPYAQAIDKLLEVNAGLPDGNKIRVISISAGWTAKTKGAAEIEAAVARAKQQGVFVITVSVSQTHPGFDLGGLGREPMSDPDNPDSYRPGAFWEKNAAMVRGRCPNILLVPMDSRSAAGFTDPGEYAFYRHGGASWTVPYMAGLYALACQVKPDVTPEVFWRAAQDTGDTMTYRQGLFNRKLGKIVNPVRLIEKLKSGS